LAGWIIPNNFLIAFALSRCLLPTVLLIAQMPVQAQTALAAPALAGAPPKVPAAQQLTLAQALEYARSNSPLLQGALYQVASARANLSGQRAPVNPIFNVGGLNNSTGPSVGPLDLGRASNYAFAFTVETNGGIGWRT